MEGGERGPKLFAVYLGGDPEPGRLSEDHETVLVVAGDLPAARAAARAKWHGRGRAHVDAVQELDVVDGFTVRLEPGASGDGRAIDTTYDPGT